MAMTNTMQAVWISTYGGPEALEIRTVGKPLINDEQVLVRVRASSLNRADLLQRQGKYDEAIGAYSKQLESNPTDRIARKNHALVLAKMKRSSEALSELPIASPAVWRNR